MSNGPNATDRTTFFHTPNRNSGGDWIYKLTFAGTPAKLAQSDGASGAALNGSILYVRTDRGVVAYDTSSGAVVGRKTEQYGAARLIAVPPYLYYATGGDQRTRVRLDSF